MYFQEVQVEVYRHFVVFREIPRLKRNTVSQQSLQCSSQYKLKKIKKSSKKAVINRSTN